MGDSGFFRSIDKLSVLADSRRLLRNASLPVTPVYKVVPVISGGLTGNIVEIPEKHITWLFRVEFGKGDRGNSEYFSNSDKLKSRIRTP